MARVDITAFRGEKFVESGVVLKNGLGFPAGSVAGYTLTFVARRKRTDTNALITKDIAGGGVTFTAGGAWTVTLLTADTAALSTELLAYDLTLTEPDGTKTVVQYGTLKVAMGAGS